MSAFSSSGPSSCGNERSKAISNQSPGEKNESVSYERKGRNYVEPYADFRLVVHIALCGIGASASSNNLQRPVGLASIDRATEARSTGLRRNGG